MALLTAPKRLLIANKNMTVLRQPDYGNDMRAIERFNPINKLVAGTGITLTPTDGSGPQVQIDASGGGGGTGFGSIEIQAGMDSAEEPTIGGGGSVYLGPSDVGSPTTPFLVTLMDTTTLVGGAGFYYATSWIIFPFAGASVCILPILTAPTYTSGIHGPINFRLVVNAWSFDSSNVFSAFSTAPIPLPSGTTVQSPITDYTPDDVFGVDLTFTAGTGTTGNGIVSAGTLALAYFGSVQFIFDVPEGITF